jgi:hypothetical protein
MDADTPASPPPPAQLDPRAVLGTDVLARLAARKALRLRFMHALYEASGGASGELIDTDQFRVRLGLDYAPFWNTRRYLENEDLCRGVTTHHFSITHQGVKEVEAALTAPTEPTEHFPPAENVILIGTAEATVIQQGNEDSVQEVELSTAALDEARRRAAELEARVRAAELEETELRALIAEATTAAAQLKSRRPRLAAVRETVGSVRDVLEAALAGGKAAAGILSALAAAKALLTVLA